LTTEQDTHAPEQAQKPTEAHRWPWIVGIVVALVVGIGIGAAAGAGDDTDPVATANNSAEIEELRSQITDLKGERNDALDALALLGTEEEPAAEDEPEPAQENEAGEVGDTAVVSWGSGDTGKITVADMETTTKPYDEYGEGPKYDRFLIFTVDLGAEADQFDVYGDDFYIVIDGTRYDHGEGNSFDATDYDDQLGYAELNAGETKSGLLVFDVPEGSGELLYAPNYEGGAIASWRF
jgi:hypothetical protein